MNNIETMKLALEALENAIHPWEKEAAITSLRQAIEQTQQAEPVAWWNSTKDSVSTDPVHRHNKDCQPLYTSPPPRQPLSDERIAKEVEAELTHYWNGGYIDTTGARDQLTAFARSIEAAHNIKGEA